MSASGFSATSGSRLFISMRRAASWCQPLQLRSVPRGALISNIIDSFNVSRTKTLYRLASAVRGVGRAHRRRSFDGLPRLIQSRGGCDGPSGASIYFSSLDNPAGSGGHRFADPLLLGAARNVVDRPRLLRLRFLNALQRRRTPEFFDLQARVDVWSLHLTAIGGCGAQPG